MQTKSKNREWKESGSPLSFKAWFQQDLNNKVKETITSVNQSDFLGADGSSSSGHTDPQATYKPQLTGQTILGINRNIVYGAGALIIVFAAYKIYQNLNQPVA